MSEPVLVSAIIIFLDAEKFIDEAVQSVLSQTYGAWELLLVDDGSMDGSTAIARRYAQEFPGRIRYLKHPFHQNRGMSASRNLGIANAQGGFLAFLDADDIWLPRKLEIQVAALQDSPDVGMVYGPTQWWYSWTGRLDDRHRDFVQDPGVPSGMPLKPPDLLVRFLRAEGISPCTCSVLLRADLARQVGGFEESFRGLYEDQAFFAKVCLATQVLLVPECSARYRQHPESNFAITQRTGQQASARRTFLLWLEAYVKVQRETPPELWQALRRELRPYRYPVAHRLSAVARVISSGGLSGLVLRIRWRLLTLPVLRRLRAVQFRTLHPLHHSRQQGTAIVRYYWSQFLRNHQSDIRGRALEIGTTATIRHYGGQALTCADAIDLQAHSPEITVVADLSRADSVPSDTYDCFVNQFTMHLIYDAEAAIYHSIRVLRPGGVLLANFPCVDYYFASGLDMGTGAPLFLYWWFTPILVENMFRHCGLDPADYQLEIYGNLFSRIAYQLNLPAEELTARELDYRDGGHPLLICARVCKPADWQAPKPPYRDPYLPAETPANWNPETGHYGA